MDVQGYRKLGCEECLKPELLGFDFTMAFQPVIDAETRSVYSHEALVRGSNGEGAASVLAQVNESNRYRFDQACRVKAIEAASRLQRSMVFRKNGLSLRLPRASLFRIAAI
ncbi:MAG: hypothetical protein OHK0011_09000 [Turneriella sp.]